jgi:hypothetical protein
MSPRQNRVTPLGDLIATPERGLVFGNRGCLHDARGGIRRRWAVRRWIACRLEFRGRRREVWHPGHYTGLFFLDEATAWAAGHRPCAECRHPDWRRFGDCWAAVVDPDRRADAIDARLHAERLDPGTGAARTHLGPVAGLPDGVFLLDQGRPHVVRGDRLLRWTPAGYRDPRPRPGGRLPVITPPALVDVLRAGWSSELPWLHPSAAARSG